MSRLRESRKQRKIREREEKRILLNYDKLEEEKHLLFKQRRRQERGISIYANLISQTPKTLKLIGSFLPWIENFQLSECVTKSFKGCCRPFEEDLYRVIAKETDLKVEHVKAAIAKGVCISGSLIHQVMYNVRYSTAVCYDGSLPPKPTHIETDIDFYHLAEFYPDHFRVTYGLKGDCVSETLVPPSPEFVTLLPVSLLEDRDLYIEDESYQNYLPLHAGKSYVLPPGQEKKLFVENLDSGWRATDELTDQRRRLKALAKTSIEIIGIRYEKSIAAFLDKFVDQTHCLVYFGLALPPEQKIPKDHPDHEELQQQTSAQPPQIPKLHWRNMHHLTSRTFEMRWDIERYMKSRWGGGRNRLKVFEVDYAFVHKMCTRLLDRCDKYIARGFTCLNPKTRKQRYQYPKEQQDELAPFPNKKIEQMYKQWQDPYDEEWFSDDDDDDV